MIGVSFAMTSDAFADGSKTETRRFWKPMHAAKFKPGTIFMGWTKDPRAGGVRMHAARVVACYRERLSMMSGYSFSAEGGTRYWPDRAAYIEAMGGPDNVPWVLVFEHLPNAKTEHLVKRSNAPPARRCATCIHRARRYACQVQKEWCGLHRQPCRLARHDKRFCNGNNWKPNKQPSADGGSGRPSAGSAG